MKMARRYQDSPPIAVVHIALYLWRDVNVAQKVLQTWRVLDWNVVIDQSGDRVCILQMQGKGIEVDGVYRLHIQRYANGEIGMPLIEFKKEIKIAREGEGGGPRYF